MTDTEISIKSNVDAFAKGLDDVARTQLPYAVSLALNKLAKLVVEGEVAEIAKDFPTATPFTKRGPGYIPSNKNKLEAMVFVKDIQAAYLSPYAEGNGMAVPAKPSGTAMIVPKNIKLNSYGNIPYKKLASLKGQANVFTGAIHLKSGARIGGVFQRLNGKGGGPRLKILARFSDPWNVKQHFDYEMRARSIIEKNVEKFLGEAMERALSTMK